MKKDKKYRIEYLDLNEDLYIENDQLKRKVREDVEIKDGTWDDLRDYVLNALYKIRDYDKLHNSDNN